MRILTLFETISLDVRIAIRSLLKNPGFLVVVILSLALGIAANCTIFSVVDTLLYRPLPYPQPEKLVVIWQTEQAHPEQRNAPPIAQQVDWNKQNHVFEDIALISFNDTASVSGLGEPRPLRTQYLTPNLFSLLGAKPIIGRVFLATEARAQQRSPGAGKKLLHRGRGLDHCRSHAASFLSLLWRPHRLVGAHQSGEQPLFNAHRSLADARRALEAGRRHRAGANRDGRDLAPPGAGIFGDQ